MLLFSSFLFDLQNFECIHKESQMCFVWGVCFYLLPIVMSKNGFLSIFPFLCNCYADVFSPSSSLISHSFHGCCSECSEFSSANFGVRSKLPSLLSFSIDRHNGDNRIIQDYWNHSKFRTTHKSYLNRHIWILRFIFMKMLASFWIWLYSFLIRYEYLRSISEFLFRYHFSSSNFSCCQQCFPAIWLSTLSIPFAKLILKVSDGNWPPF